MGSFLLLLMAASIAGAVTLVIIVALKPVTGRLFSKTWHYYMGLVPMLFFLGGAGVVNIPMRHVRPYFAALASAEMGTTASSGTLEVLPATVTDIDVNPAALASYGEVMHPLRIIEYARGVPLTAPALLNLLAFACLTKIT